MNPAWRTFAILAACVGVAGCSVPTLLDRVSYEGASPEAVELACGERFEVIENKAVSKLKVSSGVLGELKRSAAGQDCDDPDLRRRSKVERFQKAGRVYLDRTKRKECRFTDSRILSLSQYEFGYACGPEQKVARGKKSRR